ncbi:MAG: hemerythrin domain-containing protein [Polyangiales bacterium]
MGSPETSPGFVTLGRRPAMEDPRGLVLACHERIRSFCALAVRLATRDDVPVTEVVDGCGRLVRYFAEALPLHARDEEESLAPRLRGRIAALDEALRRMEDEHHAHAASVDALVEGWRSLGLRPGDRALRVSLGAASVQVRDAFEAHLRDEEAEVLPYLTSLSSAECDAIVHEIRARRAPPSDRAT